MVQLQEGSSVKKLAILSVLFLAAIAILLPTSSGGKYDVSKPVLTEQSPLLADGGPMPPFPPNPPSLMGTIETLVADGGPMPPFPPNPPVAASTTLVADGGPVPPFPPNPPSGLSA